MIEFEYIRFAFSPEHSKGGIEGDLPSLISSPDARQRLATERRRQGQKRVWQLAKRNLSGPLVLIAFAPLIWSWMNDIRSRVVFWLVGLIGINIIYQFLLQLGGVIYSLDRLETAIRQEQEFINQQAAADAGLNKDTIG